MPHELDFVYLALLEQPDRGPFVDDLGGNTPLPHGMTILDDRRTTSSTRSPLAPSFTSTGESERNTPLSVIPTNR
jgi:hypothetical protein